MLSHAFNNAMSRLQALNIRPIIIYGTLLGYRRNNDFIPEDDDIDFLVSKEDLAKIKIHLPNEVNFDAFSHKYDPETIPYVIVKSFIGGPYVDFYEYKVIDDKFIIEWDGVVYQLCDVLPLSSVEFKGWTVFVPNKIEKILSETYGDSWETPISRSEGYLYENVSKLDTSVYMEKMKIIENRQLSSPQGRKSVFTNKPICLKNGVLRLTF